MNYVLTCTGGGALTYTGDLATDCAAAGGTVGYSESTSGLPELTLADGGAIAGAMLALWAVAWGIRAIKKHFEELS